MNKMSNNDCCFGWLLSYFVHQPTAFHAVIEEEIVVSLVLLWNSLQ